MILKKMKVSCDLSNCTLAHVLEDLLPGKCKALYVSTSNIVLGDRLAQKFNILYYVDTELDRDAWYITTEYTGIFSPGA